MQPSVFTKIINGEIPSFKIYEDEKTFAFLDIRPVQYGQIVVVPRNQIDHLEDLDIDDYRALMDTARKLMAHIQEVLQPERVCLVVEGFEVPHAHVKLIPCMTSADLLAEAREASEDELAQLVEHLAY